MTPTIGDTLFTLFKNRQDDGLQKAIDNVLSEMKLYSSDSPEYAKQVKQLSKLYAMREHSAQRRVSPDTVAIVLGNLAGVLLIVSYEKHNIVTSKALTFVQKLR